MGSFTWGKIRICLFVRDTKDCPLSGSPKTVGEAVVEASLNKRVIRLIQDYELNLIVFHTPSPQPLRTTPQSFRLEKPGFDLSWVNPGAAQE